jgi:thiamine-monophosphate kinase
MKLAHLGEDRLIRELTRGFGSGKDVRIGIGDDCAVIGRTSQPVWLLLKTDCVIEGVHFGKRSDARKMGWKALARALSDIAAMSGVPEYALVTLAASPGTSLDRIKAIYDGIRDAAQKFRVTLVGGETARSPGPLFLSVCLTGFVERRRCVARSGGRAGDLIYVTGSLGGSLARKHLEFTPRVGEARWLTEHFALHAMMDLSDGLGADLPRLALASGVGFVIDRAALPCAKGRTPAQAISDGEDYELLFTISPKAKSRLERMWKSRFPRLRLTQIGRLTRKARGTRTAMRGYDHFA